MPHESKAPESAVGSPDHGCDECATIVRRQSDRSITPVGRPTNTAEPEAVVRRTNDSILLRSGYALAHDHVDGKDILSVTGLDGSVCLRMTLGKEGPVVEMQTRSLRLAATEELRLDCRRMELKATEQMVIRTGELAEIVDGHVSVQAGGLIQSEAHAQKHRARLGDIELMANDDVALQAEQIRLNSPRPAPAPTAWPTLASTPAASATLGAVPCEPPMGRPSTDDTLPDCSASEDTATGGLRER